MKSNPVGGKQSLFASPGVTFLFSDPCCSQRKIIVTKPTSNWLLDHLAPSMFFPSLVPNRYFKNATPKVQVL